MEEEITGPRNNIFLNLPTGTRFRFKSGKVWYVKLEGHNYQSESSGMAFCSYSQQGAWYNSTQVTLIIAKERPA